MAIFSRSKRKPPTSPPPAQTASSSSQQPQHSDQYGVNFQPNWPNVQQYSSPPNGYTPQTQGWLIAPLPPGYQVAMAQQSVVPPLPARPQKTGVVSSSKLKSKFSVNNLLSADIPECIPGARIFNVGLLPTQAQSSQYLNQGAALVDLIGSKFNAIITQIDGENFSGDERELVVYAPPPMWQQEQQHSGYSERGVVQGKSKGMVNNSVSSALTSTNYFAKVNLYVNSRLPPNLPPLKL